MRLFVLLRGEILEKTELKLEYEVCGTKKNSVPVIIVAAGNSSRMQGENKQFSLLLSVPVIARTLMTFENSEHISRIILVTRDDDIFAMQALAEKYNITKLSDIVCGGSTRSQSVLNGFLRLSADENYVLIHDGARPLVTEKIISSVTEKLPEFSGVTPAVSVKDTVKKVDADGVIHQTLVRSELLAVQTPQGVNKADYLTACEKVSDISLCTDDCSVLEKAGYKCVCVEGDYKNIKITTKEDLGAAEGFLQEDTI